MTRLAPLNGVATSNLAERLVVAHLNRDGWGVLKNGWPDFLVQNDAGQVRFIEVKPWCHNGLSLRQEKVAAILTKLGFQVELYAVSCSCGQHDATDPFQVGVFPNVPPRRQRRTERGARPRPDAVWAYGQRTPPCGNPDCRYIGALADHCTCCSMKDEGAA